MNLVLVWAVSQAVSVNRRCGVSEHKGLISHLCHKASDLCHDRENANMIHENKMPAIKVICSSLFSPLAHFPFPLTLVMRMVERPSSALTTSWLFLRGSVRP